MRGGSRINNVLLYFFGIILTILFILMASTFLSFYGSRILSFIQDSPDEEGNYFQFSNLSFAYRIESGRVLEVKEIHHLTGGIIEGSPYVDSFYQDINELLSKSYAVVKVKILSMSTFHLLRRGEEPYISTIYTLEVVDLLRGSTVPSKIKIEIPGQGYNFSDDNFIVRKYLPIFRPDDEWILFLTGKAPLKEAYREIGLVEDLSNLYSFSFPLKLVNGSVYSLDILTGYPLHLPASFNGTSIEEFQDILKSIGNV